MRCRARGGDRAVLRTCAPAANGLRWAGRVVVLRELGLRRGRGLGRHHLSGSRLPGRWGSRVGLDRLRDLRLDLRRHLLHGRAAGPLLAAVPVLRRPRLSRSLSPGVRRARPARALLGDRFRRRGLAGRPDRRVHRLRTRDRARARPGVAHLDRAASPRSPPISRTRPAMRCCWHWSSALSGSRVGG